MGARSGANRCATATPLCCETCRVEHLRARGMVAVERRLLRRTAVGHNRRHRVEPDRQPATFKVCNGASHVKYQLAGGRLGLAVQPQVAQVNSLITFEWYI